MILKRICFQLILMTFFLCNCGEKVIYKDYPVDYDLKKKTEEVGENPTIILGVFKEQIFNVLKDGDPIEIINGFQGGTWIHISIRVLEMPSKGEVDVDIQSIGRINYQINLTRTAEGYLEMHDIPIPVKLKKEQIGALIGQRVLLRVSYKAKGKTLNASHTVKVQEN